jgi:hypothetical protein
MLILIARGVYRRNCLQPRELNSLYANFKHQLAARSLWEKNTVVNSHSAGVLDFTA